MPQRPWEAWEATKAIGGHGRAGEATDDMGGHERPQGMGGPPPPTT